MKTEIKEFSFSIKTYLLIQQSGLVEVEWGRNIRCKISVLKCGGFVFIVKFKNTIKSQRNNVMD